MATRNAEAPIVSSPTAPLSDYEKLNILWKAMERNITLSYLHHTNLDEWIIHKIRCLAAMLVEPPQNGSEPAPSAPRPYAPAGTQPVAPTVRVLEI
ncbi:hypothetical protein QBC45DRAFT_397743 [Copromyces sp. CBS 386.78]|nr:hypothetical protein QBC45DRAFT_397743 [Copromyces sp. CBS 386.78]